MADLPDSLERALRSALASDLEKNHPNPDRVDCLDHALLANAAISLDLLSSEEGVLLGKHIQECWPCFKELKQLRANQMEPHEE